MTKATVEKTICKSCGADVREGTLFCYNCGKRVAEEPVAEAADPGKSNGDAVDEEIARRFRVDEEPPDKLAAAAAKRKKSRAGLRKPSEMVWEPADGNSSSLFVVITIVITAIAAIIVFFAVYLK